jgi:deoxyribose-phosphate aldolase
MRMITKEEFAKKMEHSILGTSVKKQDVEKACEEVLKYGFAVMYTNACDVALAKSIIGDRAGVGGPVGFPQGAQTTKVKVFEGYDAIENGATDLDIVMNVSRFKDGDADYVKKELSEFVEAMKARKPDVVVKVIVECVCLSHREKIEVCNVVADSGADYIKNATGFPLNENFHLGDIRLFKAVVGDRLLIKASGSVDNVEDAIGAIEFGANRVANNHAVRWLAEFDENRWYLK